MRRRSNRNSREMYSLLKETIHSHMKNTNKRTYRDFWPWLESPEPQMWSEGRMRHWETQGEPHNLNSGLGSLPGGGVRNQSSLSLPHISAPQPPWVPVVDSGCVLESTFLEAGSGWQDIGAAKGSNAVFLGCHPALSILCSFSTAPHAPPHPQPPECTFFPLEIFLIAASRETCLPHFL